MKYPGLGNVYAAPIMLAVADPMSQNTSSLERLPRTMSRGQLSLAPYTELRQHLDVQHRGAVQREEPVVAVVEGDSYLRLPGVHAHGEVGR